jgi:ferrous iron transport protein A
MDQVPLGSRCVVVSVDETSESLLRLMEMGLIPESKIVVERTAPLNSPFSVRLMGSVIAIRREDAEKIIVRVISIQD